MKVHFYGAAQTVTGSQHLLEVNGHRLLLECGLYQGRRQESYERNQNFPFDPSAGGCGDPVARAYRSQRQPAEPGEDGVYAGGSTRPRRRRTCATSMLIDSGHIQEQDVEYVNKRAGRDSGEPPVEPLYTLEDAATVAQHFEAVAYGQVFEPVPGVQAQLVEAGHILGSAAVVLDIEEGGASRKAGCGFRGISGGGICR